MNHIHRITRERDEARAALALIQAELTDLMAYLASPKFQGQDADHVHIRTDIMPKLMLLRLIALEG